MKTLILYNSETGDIISTQSPVEEQYTCNYLIANIPNNRVVSSVDNREVILEDTPEVKQAKERLKKLNEEISEIKLQFKIN